MNELDATLATGYRLRSHRGVQLRRWVSTVLTEYFDKMLERIRNIRASEGDVT